MATLHLYITDTGFNSEAEFDHYVLPTYNDADEFVESKFMSEVGFDEYEPMCVERVYVDNPVDIKELLLGSSYYDQWLPNLSVGKLAKAAVIVYEPNIITNMQSNKMNYFGSFQYSETNLKSKSKFEVTALVDKIYINTEKKCELMGYYQNFNVEANSPEEAKSITIDLIRNDDDIKSVWQRDKQKSPPVIIIDEIVEVDDFSSYYENNCSGRAFFSAKKWWQFWIR